MSLFDIQVVGREAVQAHIQGLTARVYQALRVTIRRLTFLLSQTIRGKLQGEVLQHRTGALSRSIKEAIDEAPPASIIGRAYSDGSVKYAAIHEFGFHGTEHVREHTRTVAFGRATDPFVVPAFDRVMNMPERSFIRSSFDELRDEIVSQLEATISEAAA